MDFTEPVSDKVAEELPKTMEAKLAEAEKFGLRPELEAFHAAATRLKRGQPYEKVSNIAIPTTVAEARWLFMFRLAGSRFTSTMKSLLCIHE